MTIPAYGWLALIVSILLVLLGIATFIWPEAALESFVMVYGVLAVATGIMDIVFYARVERHTGFGPMTALVSGILSVMCGLHAAGLSLCRAVGHDPAVPVVVH